MAVVESELVARPRLQRRQRWGSWLAAGACALFLVLAAAGVTQLVSSFSEGERGEMLRFVNAPLVIPRTWLAPRLPADLEKLVVEYCEASTPRMGPWGAGRDGRSGGPRFWGTRSYMVPGPRGELDWSALEEMRQRRRPAEEALARLVAHPGFSRRNVFAAHIPDMPAFTLQRQARGITRWLPTCVVVDVHFGRYEDAARAALLYFRARNLPPPNALSSRLDGRGRHEPHVERALAELARQCTDTALLSRTLAAMADLAPPLPTGDVHRAMLEEMIADAYARAPENVTAELRPDMWGRDLIRRQIAYLLDRGDPAGNDSWSARWNVWRNEGLTTLGAGEKQLFSVYTAELFGLSARSEEFMYWHVRRQIEELLAAEQATALERRAAFDLARLALAARLEELSGRPLPTDPESLAPRYFDLPPLDPWSGQPYRYHQADACFYSVGPDGRDDRLASLTAGDPGDDFSLARPPAATWPFVP